MIPEFVFLAAGLVVLLSVFVVLRQDKAAFAANLRERISSLRAHLEQRENLLKQNGKLQSRWMFLRQSCSELTEKETRLKEDVATLEPRAGEISEKIKSLIEEKSLCESQIAILEDDKRKWEDRIRELDRLDELLGESIKKRNDMETQIKETEEKISDYSEKLKAAEVVEENLQKWRADLERVIREVEEQKEESTALKEEKSKLEEEIEKKKNELSGLEGKVMSVEGTLEAMGFQAGNKNLTRETFQTMFEPEFTTSPGLSEDDPDLRFKGFRSYLNGLSYKFSERIVNAFHTSLKVQDVSCLTVMAGISGTGKSALPRLYADFMGMHFLMVPVEPRWDSPQDLFGFLNYVESRYEATPLGRALVQFNMREKAENNPMQDEILMILLDEMNLARVEYYFSEFLSRLETRRDEDWLNNEEAYQKVSLEIFAGEDSMNESGFATFEKKNAIRLFAGPNVFFVGTMNEDESTQSLTDKVIDRSNAIHFGRPDSLMARKGGSHSIPKNKIKFSNWQKKIRKGLNEGTTTAKIVNQFLSELNDQFDAIGRPFGHRTYSAACAYIANHPSGLRDEISELNSLADQVAMRFLPKLRGVDLNEGQSTLASIQSKLVELGDDAVLDAFNLANDKSKGYFQWRGIDWNS